MEIKEYKTPLENFTISKRTQLRMRAGSADNMLRELPGEADWKTLNPDGPGLKEKRHALIAVRDEALAELSKLPADLEAKQARMKTAATGLPVGKPSQADRDSKTASKSGGLTSSLNRIFTDGPCPSQTPETLYIEPEDVYKQRSDPNEPWYFELTERSENIEAVLFRFNLSDTNNDPWNKDYMDGWLRIFWIYNLPQWSYDARYELAIHGRLNVQAEMFSNNFLGRRWWCGYFAGGMAADNELVQVNDEYQPIFHAQTWTGDELHWDSGQIYLTKNQIMNAGETRRIFLYYWIYLFADRGTVETIGSVHAYDSLNYPVLPRLRCTISPT